MQKDVKRNLIIVLIVIFIIVVAIPVSNYFIGIPGFSIQYWKAKDMDVPQCTKVDCNVGVNQEFIFPGLGENIYRSKFFRAISGCWIENEKIDDKLEIVRVEKYKNKKFDNYFSMRFIEEHTVLKANKVGKYKISYDSCCGSCEKKEYIINVIK